MLRTRVVDPFPATYHQYHLCTRVFMCESLNFPVTIVLFNKGMVRRLPKVEPGRIRQPEEDTGPLREIVVA